LAQNVLTQATRQEVIRALYWELKVPSSLLQEAFKISQQKVSQLAGQHTIKMQCARCGAVREKRFKSWHEFKGRKRNYKFCAGCIELRNQEAARETAMSYRRQEERAWQRMQDPEYIAAAIKTAAMQEEAFREKKERLQALQHQG
jgi:hypothetical protein